MRHLPLWISAIFTGLVAGLVCWPERLFAFDHALVFVAFVPLWREWLRAGSGLRVFFLGWLAQFIFTLVAFHWIGHTMREFGHLPWPAAIGTLFLYAALANLHWPVAGWIWFRFFRTHSFARNIFSLVVLSALGERLMPMVFQWHFGYVWLHLGGPIFRLADTIGFSGLSAITWGLNGLGLLLFFGGARRRWQAAVGLVLLLGSLSALGSWRGSRLPPPDAVAKVILVQANIGNKDKQMAEHGMAFRRAIVEKYVALSRQALASAPDRPDFVLWPENAFPDTLHELGSLEEHYEILQAFRREAGVALVTGAYGLIPGAAQLTANGIFVLGSDGAWKVPHYFKTRLLPFGEYVPGDSWFPWLKQVFPQVRDFGRGDGPALLTIGALRIGPQICYEGLFEDLSRATSLLGAQLHVNVTNDSWYGPWRQPGQHLLMTLARSVETGRPLVRGTNTGHSTVGLPDGSHLAVSPLFAEWFQYFEVPYRRDPPATLFLGWGRWVAPLLLWAACLLLLATSLRARRRS